jgi:hypothetical protein
MPHIRVGVQLHPQHTIYAERTIAWLLASRLYLPEDWSADATRRTKDLDSL